MGRKSSKTGRRGLLRLGAALVVGGPLVGRLAAGDRRPPVVLRPATKPIIAVLPDCAGCTGCVTLCPTAAIDVVPGGIDVIDERCIRCGYCQAACPVGGIAVRREEDR